MKKFFVSVGVVALFLYMFFCMFWSVFNLMELVSSGGFARLFGVIAGTFGVYVSIKGLKEIEKERG